MLRSLYFIITFITFCLIATMTFFGEGIEMIYIVWMFAIIIIAVLGFITFIDCDGD